MRSALIFFLFEWLNVFLCTESLSILQFICLGHKVDKKNIPANVAVYYIPHKEDDRLTSVWFGPFMSNLLQFGTSVALMEVLMWPFER